MPDSKLTPLLPLLPILIDIAQKEILERMSRRGQTRDEVLADATAKWADARKGADDLAKLGHENDV